MVEPPAEVNCCVSRETFYQKLDDLKGKQAKNESLVTLFIDDSFFKKAKAYLKQQAEQRLGIESAKQDALQMTKWELTTIKRKNWTYENESLVADDKKKVVPRGELYEVSHTDG